MARKKQGHYCGGCNRYRANEKFSGKGHRQHFCKDCKRMGRTWPKKNEQIIMREKAKIKKQQIKVKLVVFTDLAGFLFFEYKGHRFGLNTDFEEVPIIFRHQENADFPFVVVEREIENYEELIEVLIEKYYDRMDSGDYFDYYHLLEMEELELKPNDLEYLRLVEDLQSIDSSYRFIMGLNVDEDSIECLLLPE
jgi:hypothetical protein